MASKRLTASDFQGSTIEVAKSLLGTTLVRRSGNALLKCIVVEVEAYLSSRDPASHSHRGMKTSNRSMFLPAGYLYVYPIHSRYCMNVVTEEADRGAAVLIRGAEPITGISQMWKHRFPSTPRRGGSIKQQQALGQGPGRLSESLKVDRRLDGIDLSTDRRVWLESAAPQVVSRSWKWRKSRRIGISSAQTRQLRFFIDGHHLVSGLARDHSMGRTWKFFDGDPQGD
ncbi:MAG: DNA-3-methyladenine glycosylase [Planctomycetota bacterium]